MKLILISGPYRAKTEWELTENIRHAEAAAIKMWKEGWAVICPHKNSAWFGGICDDSVWLEGDLEMLRRCDAIYMLNTWHRSEGAISELKVAQRLGLEIIYEKKEGRD